MKHLATFPIVNPVSTSTVRGDQYAVPLSRKRHMVRLYMTTILLLSLMFTMYVWQSTKMVEVKLRIQDLNKKSDSIEINNAVLKADISKLQSISRIEKVAKNDLGMVVPKRVLYVTMPVINDK
ncbi:MAG: septum formation initiator family protein [Candidatus Riflebacteria bacterium]|nr:septum formation initiator family protein [Candidatus Riflebacteria bacterium]